MGEKLPPPEHYVGIYYSSKSGDRYFVAFNRNWKKYWYVIFDLKECVQIYPAYKPSRAWSRLDLLGLIESQKLIKEDETR